MKINQTTKIVGDKVILVPYRKHHVLKYHDWMASPEIQELTASEPLSLDEEYQMQLNWQNDDDKLTFIVLRRDFYESFLSEDNIEKEKFSMIGDVNAFISTEIIEEEDGDDDLKNVPHVTAELEIMIPGIENRGHGFGSEAVYLMINYCVQNMHNPPIGYFHVKINEDNISSIKMFERLGFENYKYIKVFKEQCLKLKVNYKTFQGELENKKLAFFNKYAENFLPIIDVNYN
jgi:RimJ/RimL family protein N-acetyltransferase